MASTPGKKIVLGVGLGLAVAVGAAFAQAQPAAKPADAAAVDPKAAEFFEAKIRPLLAQQCFSCHGEKKAQGGLRVDTAEGLFKGGALGNPVKPGHPETSLLIDAVSYTKDLKMPPQGKLKPQQIADLTAWVKMGAPWPNAKGVATTPPAAGGQLFTAEQRQFWAFQPVKEPALPAVKNKAWVTSPIDAFVLAKLEEKGLKPSAKADKRTLIRRVTFDITGLPPTPEEIDAFLKDTSPSAWTKVIDRLLASPAYGERWARHWLDIARYADSNGLDENTAFGNAWRYRDYVIHAFNADKPYDQFVREQIAGDLLPASQDKATQDERLIATGFLVLGPKVLAEPDKDKMVMDIVDEQIDTMGKSILGLTLGCARCHDHKFDPLPTKDYYSLAGIFKSTRTMQSLNTVAKAYERPVTPDETVVPSETDLAALQMRKTQLRGLVANANAEASRLVVKNLPRYLMVGLKADVRPLTLTEAPELTRPGTVQFEAEKFLRGDVTVTTNGAGKGIGIIESAGRTRAYTEYEFETPKAAEYEIWLRYASGEVRPLNLLVDGRSLRLDAASRVTGGFGPDRQEWEQQLIAGFEPGKHLLRLDQTAGAIPHVDKIVLVPAGSAMAAAPGPRPRTATVMELARVNALQADILRRSAAALLPSASKGSLQVWEPWLLLSSIPDAQFEVQAPKLIAEWKSSKKLSAWLPPVAALFTGSAPKSLAEVAEGYGRLFTEANEAWLKAEAESMTEPRRLPDAGQEALRKELYGKGAVFGLDRIEALYPRSAAANIDAVKKQLARDDANAQRPPAMALAVEDAHAIADCKVHIRGNTLTLGDVTPRQFPRILAGESQTPIGLDHSGRLELAEWLARPDNPLTARVMVNRIWEHHFGEGIVRTPDNFGKLGDRPSHPELLDWLAKRFVEKGWSMKAVHRLILLSNTYQMSTAPDPKAALADPENRLLSHFNRRRLEVEAIRDSMLAVAGNLDPKMGGSLLKTRNFEYVTNDQSGNGAQYDAPRRSIYLPVIRNAVFDVFQVFDFVEPSFPNGKRAVTTVAPQALFMLNGKFVLDEAELFAKGLGEANPDAERIRAAILRAYGRPAAPQEVSEAEAYLKTYSDALTQKEANPAKRREQAWRSYCQVLFASNEFVVVN